MKTRSFIPRGTKYLLLKCTHLFWRPAILKPRFLRLWSTTVTDLRAGQWTFGLYEVF